MPDMHAFTSTIAPTSSTTLFMSTRHPCPLRQERRRSTLAARSCACKWGRRKGSQWANCFVSSSILIALQPCLDLSLYCVVHHSFELESLMDVQYAIGTLKANGHDCVYAAYFTLFILDYVLYTLLVITHASFITAQLYKQHNLIALLWTSLEKKNNSIEHVSQSQHSSTTSQSHPLLHSRTPQLRSLSDAKTHPKLRLYLG